MAKTGWVLLAAVALAYNAAFGHEEHKRDTISGAPLADFSVNELRIPCVEVKNLDPNVDGRFFDVILDRRGNSMNFELKFAEVEDSDFCRALADFAKFYDDDFDDDASGTKILVICERRSNRSKISVNGKNLIPGAYSAVVNSGTNTASAPLQSTSGDEVEFDFDSDPGDIAEGATAIAPDFIQGTVSARLLNQRGEVVAAVSNVACLAR
ncbi:MAG: hypothetical protein N3A55_07455 [Methylohalobius sp.]|nr:hypothetical protein [Methylohalobius sp.]